MRDLREGQQKQETQRQADKEEVSQSLLTLSQQFASSLESFQRAQQVQQEQLVAGMNELKAMVASSRSANEPPKKRPATSALPGMEWESGQDH